MAIYHGIKIHALCEMVPEASESEYAEIREDIRKNGFDNRFPIVMIGEWVLDGRTRLRACKELGIEPPTEEWKPCGPSDTPGAFVLRSIRHRRLTDAQYQLLAVKLLIPEEIKKDKKAARIKPVLTPPPTTGQCATRTPQTGDIPSVKKLQRHGVSRQFAEAAVAAKKHNPEAYGKLLNGQISAAEAKRQSIGPPPPVRAKVVNPTADEAIASGPRFDDIAKRASELRRDLEKLAAEPVGRELRAQRLALWLKDFASEVRSAKPFGPCPCEGERGAERCKMCDGFAWLTEAQLKLIPKR